MLLNAWNLFICLPFETSFSNLCKVRRKRNRISILFVCCFYGSRIRMVLRKRTSGNFNLILLSACLSNWFEVFPVELSEKWKDNTVMHFVFLFFNRYLYYIESNVCLCVWWIGIKLDKVLFIACRMIKRLDVEIKWSEMHFWDYC